MCPSQEADASLLVCLHDGVLSKCQGRYHPSSLVGRNMVQEARLWEVDAYGLQLRANLQNDATARAAARDRGTSIVSYEAAGQSMRIGRGDVENIEREILGAEDEVGLITLAPGHAH